MKKNLILSLLFLLTVLNFALSQERSTHTSLPIDDRLLSVFERQYLEDIKAGNPFLLQRMNFYLDHSWYMTDLPPEKSMDEYPLIEMDASRPFNIFLLEREHRLQRDWDKQTVIRIGESGKALVLLSGKDFNDLLNKHLKRS